MKYSISNLKNNIDFFIRQHFNCSRKKYAIENESKENILTDEILIEYEKMLFEKFDVNYLKSNSTIENYLQNLCIIDILDKYLDVNFKEKLDVLDVGCKNWFYVKGEYSFFKKYCNDLNLDGIELDVNRLYSNFYTRGETAKFYINSLDGANYIAGDFLYHKKKYDYIIWILPFVFEYPMMKWGLPHRFFQPEKMLKHAHLLLNENGEILILNQGKHEYNAQKELCDKLNIDCRQVGLIDTKFYNYNERYLTLIKK